MGYLRNLLKNSDKILLLLPLLFAVISLTMIASIFYDDGAFLNRNVITQGAAYIIGFVIIIIAINLDYAWFRNFPVVLYACSIAFLLTVYVPGLGMELNGARSWIDLRITTFQPSELVKISFVLVFAKYLQDHRNDLYKFRGLFMAFLYAIPFIAIVAKEDMGSGLVFCAMWVFMVFFAGLDYKIMLRTLGLLVISSPVLYRFMAYHQKQRILAFLHPDDLSIEATYQVWQSKIAIGSGGLWGKGLFHGTQKALNYLPVQSSDFIFAVICEETGFVGGAVLILLYVLFVWRIAKICHESKDLYGSLIAIGFIGMFSFQIFENIAMTMGIMPVTGITLPFISYGGSSVVSNMIALGLVINIGARSKNLTY